ncbi:MAG TPA: ABC transporter ATP-binding protein [Phycisphaerae bacterium]|nr:ABC transporter ATP-binding protein [Phycisphaerae bacterium]
MNSEQDIIRLEKLSKTYLLGEVELRVLKDITLNVRRGEMVALMGASGSGKTTLMNILGCLDQPTSGRYWLDGEEISRLSSNQRAELRSKKIGFVFQSFNLLPKTSALDNVLMPLTYSHRFVSEREAKNIATRLLQKVGLADRMDHYPSQLSGGQQQRVAIARSLVNSPVILFADEPTGNLDSHTSLEVLEMFGHLNRDEGITIVLVTHDANVAKYTQRTIRIRDGEIIDDLPSAQIMAAVGVEGGA